MNNKFYLHLLNLSVAALACAAVLAGNAAPIVPLPNDIGNRTAIIVQEEEDAPDSELGIMPLNDSEFIDDYFD